MFIHVYVYIFLSGGVRVNPNPGCGLTEGLTLAGTFTNVYHSYEYELLWILHQ